MSYSTQSLLAHDIDILDRATSCAATQGLPNPFQWVGDNQWALSASPGWDEAYAYALNVGTERPGWQETVISDGMILSAVQLLIAAQAVPEVPLEEPVDEPVVP